MLSNGAPSRIVDMLTTDINDRVTVDMSGMSVEGDFYVQRVSTDIDQGGRVHRATFTIRQQPAFEVDPDDLFRFGSGEFDTHEFGR